MRVLALALLLGACSTRTTIVQSAPPPSPTPAPSPQVCVAPDAAGTVTLPEPADLSSPPDLFPLPDLSVPDLAPECGPYPYPKLCLSRAACCAGGCELQAPETFRCCSEYLAQDCPGMVVKWRTYACQGGPDARGCF